jgi:hypothetical protein
MGPIRDKGGGGSELFWGGPKHFWPLLRHFNCIIGILSSSPVDWHPFEQIGLREGSVDMSKRQRHTRSSTGRGVSQANEAAIHSKP